MRDVELDEFERADESVPLRSVTIAVRNLAELDLVVAFLQAARADAQQWRASAGIDHVHWRDFLEASGYPFDEYAEADLIRLPRLEPK